MKTLLKSICLVTSFVAPLLAAGQCSAADLTIEIADVKPSGGNLMIAVYDTADNFLKKPLTGVRTPAKPTGNTVLVKDLPAGDYAIAVYHDVNENGKMDKNMIGIPTEDYAFSNNAIGKMGPPSFELARLTVPEAGLTTRVSLR